MNPKFKRLLFLALPFLGGGVFFLAKTAGSSSNPEATEKVTAKTASSIPVTGIVAAYSGSNDGITAMGTLLANEEVDLVAEIAGKVVRICFQEGAPVDKGDLLLKVDDADLQAQLSRAEFQRKLLTERLERQRVLLKRESISREEFDQLQTDYNVLEADIELLKVKIARTEVRAPFNGTMGFRYVSEGSYLQPSTKIARIVDNGTLKFEFSIPERFVSKTLKGKDVPFHVSGKESEFKAQIYAVDPQIDVNTRAILIRARVDNRKGELYPGMFANGKLYGNSGEQFIPVPTEAVVPEMDGKRVWILRGGRAASTRVETVNRDQKNVSVISGVLPGDTVLTSGLMQLREGAPVKVTL